MKKGSGERCYRNLYNCPMFGSPKTNCEAGIKNPTSMLVHRHHNQPKRSFRESKLQAFAASTAKALDKLNVKIPFGTVIF